MSGGEARRSNAAGRDRQGDVEGNLDGGGVLPVLRREDPRLQEVLLGVACFMEARIGDLAGLVGRQVAELGRDRLLRDLDEIDVDGPRRAGEQAALLPRLERRLHDGRHVFHREGIVRLAQ